MYGFGGELFGRRRFGQRLAGDRGGEPAHELQQTGAAGVDDPRVTEDVELLPRLRHCSLPAFDERVQELRGGAFAAPLCLLGECADDRQHRPLDGLVDRAVGLVARAPDRAGNGLGVERLGLPENVGRAADDLRQDHARVAAGAQESRTRHLRGELFAIGFG